MATPFTLSFEAIGTQWVITLQDDVCAPEELRRAIMDRIESFDKTYSRFRSDSLVTTIAQQAGHYRFPDDADALFALYKQLYAATDGKVTPLIGGLMADAGYDASYSLQPAAQLRDVPAWPDVMTYREHTLVTTRPVALDFGAAGKGYLVDLVGQVLQAAGLQEFVIDAGGDILRRTAGQSRLRVGLEHPADPTQAIGVMELQNGSICASAGNRRKWQGFHHIIDPDRKNSVEAVLATWVSADTALLADGLATALFFAPADRLRARFDFDYVLVRDDFTFARSPGFKGELFTGDTPG